MPRPEPARVDFDDLERLRQRYRAGQVVPFADLFEAYLEVAEKPPARRNGFSRAMTTAGWEHRVVRKSRGRRGRQQVLSRTICRVIPGGPEIHVEDDRMGAVLRQLIGDSDGGIFQDVLIQEAYMTTARRQGWTCSMNHRQMARWLNEKGFTLGDHGGQKGRGGRRGIPSRVVDRATIDRVSPGTAPLGPVRPAAQPPAPEPTPAESWEDLFVSIDDL